MPSPKYDQAFWEELWAKTLREHPDKVARRPPNAHLVDAVKDLPAGRALDAGCGHGAETLWLAAHGWRVTGVDFSQAALRQARAMADTAGAELSERVELVEGDLSRWSPEPERYDLVVSLHVHAPDGAEALVRRLARGVAPGGTLFLVGHSAVDPATGAATSAAGQVQVTLPAARAALDEAAWRIVLAEERPRTTGGGVDAVIRAERLTPRGT